MNILLIGEHYSTNLGDGVIYNTVKKMLKKQYKCSFSDFDISGNTQFKYKKNEPNKYIKKRQRVLRKYMSLLKRSIKVKMNLKKLNYSEIDYAVFVGGQLIMEYFTLPMYIILRELEKRNIPVIFNCCGLGKNDKKINIKLMKKTLSRKNVIAISLRDNIEKFNKLYNKDNRINAIQVLDPVIEYIDYTSIKKEKERAIVGIGLMEPQQYIKNGINLPHKFYVKLVENIIQELENNNKEWEFFTNGSNDDYNFTLRICEDLNIPKDKIRNRPQKPEELIKCISNYEKVIAFRLHAHIIATSLGIKTYGFIWDNKVKDFAKNISRSEYFVNIEESLLNTIQKNINHFITNDDDEIEYKIIKDSKFIESLNLNKGV